MVYINGGAVRNPMNALRAELTGNDQAMANGVRVKAYAPTLALCRKLIEAGFDPDQPLHAYRGDVLCLSVRTLAEGACLTVEDDSSGKPRFRPLRIRTETSGTAPHIAPSRRGAIPVQKSENNGCEGAR